MLIICTRGDFIYTFTATAWAVLPILFLLLLLVLIFILLLVLIFVFRRRRCSRVASTAACRDNIRRLTRTTWVRNLCAGVWWRAFSCTTTAAWLLLFTTGRWRWEGSCREGIKGTIRRPRRLMRELGIFFRRRSRVARIRFVGNRLVRWNRLYIASLFLEQKIKLNNRLLRHPSCPNSPIYCNDVDSIRSTWRCPSNFLLLHREAQVVEHRSHEIAVCNLICCIACRHQLLLSILSQLPHRYSMLKE